MAIRNIKGNVEDKIRVENIIISVYDKAGLEDFIKGLVERSYSLDLQILSTGGSFAEILKIVSRLPYKKLPRVQVSEISKYTGFPEMEGGLVKTLHPKIHAGILGERNNPAHQEYLKCFEQPSNAICPAVYIDMVVVNLYPFEKVISEPGCTFENARGNIDIGGPCMLRAAAKNFPGCAAVCDPNDYETIIQHLRDNDGRTTFDFRLKLAKKVFEKTSKYDNAIFDYFAQQALDADEVMAEYKFSDFLTNEIGL